MLLALAACGGGDSDPQADKLAALTAAGITPVQEDLPVVRAPVDDGSGEPPIAGARTAAADERASALALAPPGAPNVSGRFTAAFNWPLIPIHTTVLPDGRVLSYGSDELGQQSGLFNYAIWDPTLGTGTQSHLLLPNTTATDIFCSAQIVLPRTGEILLTGGDKIVGGARNYSVPDVNFFDYLTNTLRRSTQSMALARWYPSVVTLTDGNVLVLGGRDTLIPTPAIATPELYDVATGWRSLTGATNNNAYGSVNSEWFYPRAWVGPNGLVFVVTNAGTTWRMNPAGTGSITQLPLTVPATTYFLPAVMYAPGKILTLRTGGLAGVIDINPATPTYAATAPVSQERLWGSSTVLADGRVFVSGGSRLENQATDVAYQSELWNPATGTWTAGATATRMRLYHSTSMLMPDARVLTAGGGAPGPVINLNAELYEPPYLFKADGSYATRPVIQTAPLQAAWSTPFTLQTNTTGISKVAFVKTGSVTHSVDFDQRYIPLAYTQTGNTLTVQAPASAALAPPGNYMVFVFDSAGVPSVAKIVRLAAATDVFPNSVTVRARASLAGGVGATMEVRLGGALISTTQVTNTAYQNFSFPLPTVTPGGAKLEVVYTNDATIGAENRNLYVESVTINRRTLLPTASGVVFDRGSGAAAFDNADTVAGTTDLTVNGALRFYTPGASATTAITVRARADIAEGLGAIMKVYVDGALGASVEVRDLVYTDYVLSLPMAVNPGAKLDVAFANDGSVTGDRNLYVESVVVNGSTLRPTDPGVTVDIGSGAASFDGIQVIPGQGNLLWNAALRLSIPAASGEQLTVRARATLTAGVGPIMQVLVAGVQVGAVEVKSAAYTDIVFPLSAAVAPGARIDVVFTNDGGSATEDRNLYIESVKVNGATLSPTDAGVTVDLGVGAAAFDGINTLPGQTDILWSAALRMTAPSSTPPPPPPTGETLTVRARATLAANVGPVMQVLVAGVQVGSVEVRAAAYTDIVFPLSAAVTPGARVDVVFTNDGGNATEDRNLYIESVTVNGTALLPTAPGVTVDIGSGAAAFDGLNTLPGQGDILWNAALRLTAPNSAPPPNAPTLTVRARATLTANVGPIMQVLVGGVQVGSVEVRAAAYTDIVFPLSAAVATGARVDIVFVNDGGSATEDRNLYIESVTVNGAALLPTDAGVTVDIGTGAAAFDGATVLPGQTDILWNAALRMFAR
ncbi:MAG: carbohydrate-binding domain-containing protein [Burkholderiaceae bacterium]